MYRKVLWCIFHLLRGKLEGFQTRFMKQATDHQAKEASLLDQLHDAQQQQRNAEKTCKGWWSTFYYSLLL